MTWQPIETAPKDGTHVDLWVTVNGHSFRITDCYYGVYDSHTGRKYWLEWAQDLSQPQDFGWAALDADLEKIPTHWMPIPARPVTL